ncbi:MAG: LysM peptidoglycan-binding domain-containing protein [Candidatus Cryptobacteroides sp.]
MDIRHIIAVLTAGLFIATAAAAPRDGVAPRKKLSKENTELRRQIDSLRQEIETYRAELHLNDSIAEQVRELYEDNEGKGGAGLNPEDYTPEISDSLLNLWYVHKKTTADEIVQYDMDSVKFSSNVPDEVYVERIKAMNSFISLPYNDIVRNYIILYSEKMPTKMGSILGLCDYYMPIFQEIFDRYDMPEELKAMAVIESALNPLAVSRAGAKGMWQFMYSTAKIYGLNINSFVDERLDPVKSADAAARYLKDAYEIFGDWNLAIASYNCGAGNVNKAIRRSGGKRAFWDIWPYLPRETRGYVPAFVGALYAMTYYKEHGIRPEPVQMPAHVDTFKINKMLHFGQVAELTGAPMEQIKNLNPQYKHEIIPGNEREYILRLPYKYTNSFIEHQDSIHTYKSDIFFNPVTIKKIKDGGDGERIVYKVKSGDYLGRIASKYHVSVAQIKRWNNLSSNNIRIGQKLVIYRGGGAPASSASSSASSSSGTSQASSASKSSGTAASSASSSASTKSSTSSSGSSAGQQASVSQSGDDYVIYVVKEGESLYSIAKKFPGVSAQNIMDYNKIGANIKPGMKIRIPKL